LEQLTTDAQTHRDSAMHFSRLVRRLSTAMLGFFLACALTHASDTKPDLTPLMSAAASGDLKAVQDLIAKGANVRERTKTGETALYEAIDRQNPDEDNLPIVAALLKAGADPNEVEVFSTSTLVTSLTAEYGNPDVTLLLMRSGARVPLRCEDGDSVVALATMGSSLEVLQALLGVGAPADCPGIHNQTALHKAVMNGQADRIALLLQYGASPWRRDEDGQTPFDLAITDSPDDFMQAHFEKIREMLNPSLRKPAQKKEGTTAH
jgi:ankyrin repeat protein